ncbi:MAG: PaaI family thioesterase [Aquabacterium sp.]
MSTTTAGMPRPGQVPHPFAELIGLVHRSAQPGHSTMELTPRPEHLNPNHVVHGAVLYAMADVGMGAALSTTLAAGELCATIQITMNYFKPVTTGLVVCTTEMVNRGRRVANFRSLLEVDGVRVASADGNYAIFKPGVA